MKKALFFLCMRLLCSFVLPKNRSKSAKNPKNTQAGSSSDGKQPGHSIGVEQAARGYLLYVILPLWMGAGLLDWYHHRRTKIEETSGTHESITHALMMSEAGFPIMMGLFLDVNALVLLCMIIGFFLHEATNIWDVAYAADRREVVPGEQHVHSFLEVLPFMTVSFMICLHWDQFLALLGQGKTPADFGLRGKSKPLSRTYILAILSAVGATVILPYTEELVRCYRTDRTLASHPVTHPIQHS